MPTYEYQCTKCNEHFEYFQSIKDAPKKTCEACGGDLTKLLSAGTGLIFKGSGFYITDYKSSGNGAPGKEGSSSESKSAPSSPSPAAPSSGPASSSSDK